MTSFLRLETDRDVAVLTIDRPTTLNALDPDVSAELSRTLRELRASREVRAIVLTGSGRAFCAGGDLRWAASHPLGFPAAFHELTARVHEAVNEIRRSPKPVVAALNGVAAGGGFSLALACDFRVMARSATLRQAYTSAGLSIDAGGTFALPRLVGVARALEIAALDEPIAAEQALAWGLATRVVPDDELLAAARDLAGRIAAGSLASFAMSKRLLTDSLGASWEFQLEREREGIVACAATAEGAEGLRAFAEKRRPDFRTASRDA